MPTASVDLNHGFVFVSGDDTDHHTAISVPTTLDTAMQRIITTCIQTSGVASPKKDILAFGIQQFRGATNFQCNTRPGLLTDAYVSFIRWTGVVGSFLSRTITYDIVLDAATASTVNFADYRMIYFPSQKAVAQCSNNFAYTLCDIETALSGRKAAILNYINVLRGSIFSLEETVKA